MLRPTGILHRNFWCIKTVIHETLHACSLQTSVPDLDKRYKDFFEGLTEFYTGYVLHKSYPNTYNNCWRTEDKRLCQLTYPLTTKIWNAFSKFIPINHTYPIYFYNGNNNWKELVDEFVKEIQQTYPQFDNFFSGIISCQFI